MTIKAMIPALALGAVLLMAFAASPARPRIKEMRQLKGNDSLTGRGLTKFFYDNRGRIFRIENSSGVTSLYDYKPDVIYRNTYDARNKKSFTDTFLLNKDGLVLERRLSGLSAVRGRYLYGYDESGHVKRITSNAGTPGEGQVTYTYNGENQVTITQRFKTSPWKSGSLIAYTDKANTIGNENMGMDFDGKSSGNLVAGARQFSSDSDTARSEYHYHLDAEGRVSVKATYYNGRLGDSTAYTYY